jgi:CBS domain containing-hemolysin-like protein
MELVGLAAAALVLLGVSASLSGSETVFFSLTPAERTRLSEATGFAERPLRHLLRAPDRLLLTLLLANLAANLLFLSLASELAVALERRGGRGAALAAAGGAVLVLVLAGELLPKILARPRAGALAPALAWPLWLLERTLSVPVQLFSALNAALARRLFGSPTGAGERRGDFRELLDVSTRGGALHEQQRRFLHEVAGFSSLRVRDVMVPRVDVATIDVDAPRERVVEEIRARSVSRLLAIAGDVDHVVGQVEAHRVLLEPDVPLCKLVRPVPAVPEIGTARGALRTLEERGSTLAVAVDEYGGTAGLVTLHDLVAQIAGEMADEHAIPARRVVERSRDRFLVAGWTSLREWRERAGVAESGEPAATVGGMVVRRLDRAPRIGDVVRGEGFDYCVRQVRGGRVVLIEACRVASAEVPA